MTKSNSSQKKEKNSFTKKTISTKKFATLTKFEYEKKFFYQKSNPIYILSQKNSSAKKNIYNEK